MQITLKAFTGSSKPTKDVTSLPRIDEIEDNLNEEWDNGNLKRNLNKELIDELKEIDLLKTLVRKRVESFVNETIATKKQATTEEDSANGENDDQK